MEVPLRHREKRSIVKCKSAHQYRARLTILHYLLWFKDWITSTTLRNAILPRRFFSISENGTEYLFGKRRENIHNIFAFCLKGFSSVAAIACIQSDYSCTYRLYKKTCMHYYAFPRHYKREPIFNNLDTCKLVWRQNWHRMIMKEVNINALTYQTMYK